MGSEAHGDERVRQGRKHRNRKGANHMAILMREEVPGMTTDQFNALFAPLVERITSFPGFLANAVGPIPGGYQVTEVWESQEAHERWMREVIVPTMHQAGLDQPLPPPLYLPLDRFMTR
jgi:heme-degrading monooxygenase HmoA